MTNIAQRMVKGSIELNRLNQEINILIGIVEGCLYADNPDAANFRRGFIAARIPNSRWRFRQHEGKYFWYFSTALGNDIEVRAGRNLRFEVTGIVHGNMGSLIEGLFVLAPWMKAQIEPYLEAAV